MRSKDIKEGHVYVNASGTVKRFVLAIGMEHRPGTALTPGVWFDQDQLRTTLVGGRVIDEWVVSRDHKAYLDTFATWAKKEIRP